MHGCGQIEGQEEVYTWWREYENGRMDRVDTGTAENRGQIRTGRGDGDITLRHACILRPGSFANTEFFEYDPQDLLDVATFTSACDLCQAIGSEP